MKTDQIKKIIEKTRKGYKHLAKIELEGNRLVNRNKVTGVLHPFSDGSEVINISQSQIVEVGYLLK